MKRTLSANRWRSMRDEAETQTRASMPRTDKRDPREERPANSHTADDNNAPVYKCVYSA